MNNNESSSETVLMGLGGVIAVIAVGYVLMKAAEKALDEASRFFDSVGHATSSFAVMLFGIGKVVAVVVIVAAAIVCAVYMTYKYIMLVKRVVEIREEFNRDSWILQNSIQEKCDALETELRKEFWLMHKRVDEFLKPATPMPEPVLIAGSSSPTVEEPAEVSGSLPNNEDHDEELTAESEENPPQEDSNGELQEFEASNPY